MVTGTIGAVTGFGGNVLGQLISNRFNVRCIKWGDTFIAAGVGAAAGAAAPFVATSWIGAIALGAAANTTQYEATQYAHGETTSVAGAAWSAATGALAGPVGGRFNIPTLPYNTNHWIGPAAARVLNDWDTLSANVGLPNFLRSLGASTTGSVDPPSESSDCACQ